MRGKCECVAVVTYRGAGKTKRYVDFPITDVLQMMGRAGRPQFDSEGIAVILVHDVKKHFYQKFMLVLCVDIHWSAPT